MTVKRDTNPTATPTNDEAKERRVFFRAVPVFDRSQVTEIRGKTPAPLEPPCEPLSGESHAS